MYITPHCKEKAFIFLLFSVGILFGAPLNATEEDVSDEEFAEFLRQKVINNPAQSLSPSHYTPGPRLDWQSISYMLNNRKFDDLDSIFEKALQNSAINVYGIPNFWDGDDLGFELSDLAILNDYCNKNRASPWPFLFRAEYYNWYAWEARGTGYASTITVSDAHKFNVRLGKAIEDYHRVKRLRPSFVYSYTGAGCAAMLSNRKRTALQEYQKALALDPANWEALNNLFEHSKTKWYGIDDNLMFEFAREIAAKHPEYPYLKRLILKAHEEMAWRHAGKDRAIVKAYLSQPDVWNEIIQIYRFLLNKYPESKNLKKFLSTTANWAGKKEEIGDLLW
jgi:hypothetical protein